VHNAGRAGKPQECDRVSIYTHYRRPKGARFVSCDRGFTFFCLVQGPGCQS
jgi:hypothetical protein